MITAFTYCGKFENFTFCIEPLSLHFIVTLPVFNVLSIFPIVPVENVEPPNNANGAYDIYRNSYRLYIGSRSSIYQ